MKTTQSNSIRFSSFQGTSSDLDCSSGSENIPSTLHIITDRMISIDEQTSIFVLRMQSKESDAIKLVYEYRETNLFRFFFNTNKS